MSHDKRCFTYCGDDKCDCPARGFDAFLAVSADKANDAGDKAPRASPASPAGETVKVPGMTRND